MKRGIVYVLMFVLMVTFVSASTSTVVFSSPQSGANLELGLLRYSPVPAEPGQYIDLWVTIESQSSVYGSSILDYADLKDVELELIESYPFSLNPGEDPVQEVGTLGQSEPKTLKYRIFVDEDASSGDHEIRFKFRSGNYLGEVTSPALDINVRSIDTTMSVTKIETEPELLSPGKPATLSITVRNDALQTFKNIEAAIDIDGDTIPIVPYKSSKEQTLRLLPDGEEHTFVYSIIVEQDATAGVYKIPFTLSYKDANSTTLKQDTFGVLIGAEGDLEFNLEEFDTFQKGKNGDVVVSVGNVGPSELKFMTIELQKAEGYVVLGRNKEYLGNLDSDDFETSTFDIHVDSKEDIPLKFKVVYKDTYNEEIEETFELTLPVYTNGEIKAYGLNGKTKTYVTYILYLLIIIFLFYTYKGWKVERRLDKAPLYGLKETIKFPFRVVLFFRPKNLRRLPKKVKLFFADL